MDCSNCPSQVCQVRQKDDLPDFCPMLDSQLIKKGVDEYKLGDNEKFYADSLISMGQSAGGRMPRIIEAVNFCRIRGYKKIGVAYCSGMLKFGRAVTDVFKSYGFEVVSCGCKTGGFGPEELVDESLLNGFGKRNPPPAKSESAARKPRAMCNPIGQAILLNNEGTDFNVIAGLCVGHDSLFIKYSNAPCTTVVLKDRLYPAQCAPSIEAAASYGPLPEN